MSGPDLLHARGDAVVLEVFVQPGAARTTLGGTHGSRLKIKVAAPPRGGRANRAVEDFVAELVGVPRARVTVVAGGSSRFKRIEISGIDVPTVRRALEM